MIDVNFNRLKLKALVDTGAQISAITKSLYDQLVESGEQMEVLPIRKFLLRGAFSERGSIIAYKARLKFEYRDKTYEHEFYIVEQMAYEMILGIEFLIKYGMKMQCCEELEITFDKDLEAIDQDKMQLCAMTMSEADEALEAIINENIEIFKENKIGRINHYEHEIELTSDKPFKKRTYPIPEKHMKQVRKYIRKLEKQGIITKQATEYINALVVVIKRSGDIRLCLDARELNKRIASDHAQPPTIEEVFRRIGRKRYYSTLDVTSAFWQIPLKEESKRFTGFLFNGQSYVFERMPFGIKTAGASFTRAMNMVLGTEC